MTHMIGLWKSLSLKKKLLSLTIIFCLVIFGIATISSNFMIIRLSDQQAAKRWNKDGGFSQVTCFFSKDITVDEFALKSFEKNLELALKEAAINEDERSGRQYISSYSSSGMITVISEQASLEAKAIGIGGDFFFFHPLMLVEGGYFSGNNLMKDYALLDEEAAWRLFGSNDVEGMSVMISGIPHYIAGVYSREEGRMQEAAGLDEMIIFVSYESLNAYGIGESISTYELVAPNPVKKFVFHLTKEKFGYTEDEMMVVENSSRYSIEALISILMDFGVRSMHKGAFSYPYWENLARGYEDIRAVLFLVQAIFLILPSVAIFVVLIRKGRSAIKVAGKFLKNKLSMYGILILALVSLTGCGETSDESKSQASKDYVYNVEALDLKGDEYQTFSLLRGKERIYAYSYNYGGDEGLNPWIDFWTINEDGTIKEKNKIEMDVNSNLYSLCPDGDGAVYAIKNVYPTEPDENGIYKDIYYLIKMSEQGEEIFSINLNDIPQLTEAQQDYFYINGLVIIDNAIYINVLDLCVKFDADGNFEKILKSSNGGSFENVMLYSLENGKAAAVTHEENGVYAAYVDLETGEFTNKTKFPGTSYEYSFYPGIGYDFYMVNSYGVFGYNIGDEDKTQIMNYIDSDLGAYSLYNLIPIDDKSFLATYDDMETYEMTVGRFTKVPPAEVKDKTNLTLACAGMNWDVRTAVVSFNKNSDEYRITVEDYSSLYSTENDYMAGINRLNTDIIAGKIPDILLVDSNMPVDSYIAKGLLEDVKPYIQADEELDINDYMPNIIEAYSVDGKLYSIVPSFMIHTLLAKTSDVGSERGWSVREAKELLASKPEGTELFTFITRDQVLQNCLLTDGLYIDWKNGQCNFESDSFVELLEFAATFPEQIDDALYTEDYWQNYESQWREGKVLCQQVTLSDFRNYNYTAKGTFGEAVTMIGYPTGEGDGSAIIPSMQLSMSAKSKNKDGAYSFLRHFLTKEYQEKIEFGYPISIERLDGMAQDAMKVATYTDENGQVIESPEMYYLNGMEIEIKPITQEEAEALKADLYSITNVYAYDDNLMQIIEEETAAFFSGQKKAEDVADIIQSRVQIYVNENR